jgi:hypothetical protein
MKKILLSLGILLSLSASTLFAQEKKTNVFFSTIEKIAWDVRSPIQSMEGSTAHLIINTENKIEKLSFIITWYLKDGSTILSTEKEILHVGNVLRSNDMPETFQIPEIWYNLYILPSPDVNHHEINKVTLSGKFLSKKTWSNMNELTLAYIE